MSQNQKEKTVKLTEKETEIVKEALKDRKTFRHINTMTKNPETREKAISDIYDIEQIEKKLK